MHPLNTKNIRLPCMSARTSVGWLLLILKYLLSRALQAQIAAEMEVILQKLHSISVEQDRLWYTTSFKTFPDLNYISPVLSSDRFWSTKDGIIQNIYLIEFIQKRELPLPRPFCHLDNSLTSYLSACLLLTVPYQMCIVFEPFCLRDNAASQPVC